MAKFEKLKQWAKKHEDDIIMYAWIGATIWTVEVVAFKTGARAQRKLCMPFVNGSEWALHKKPEIRELFKDENAKLWIGVMDGALAYKLED